MTTVTELQEKSAKLRQFFDQHLPYARPTPVLADFIRVQHELMWGGVWLVDGLDLKLRSFATITAQCVNGYDFGVEHQVRTGLTVGITAQQIKGIFIQLLFYAGVPATVFGLRIAQEVIDEREEWKSGDVPLDIEWLASVAEMLAQGKAIRIANWGEHADAENRELPGPAAGSRVRRASGRLSFWRSVAASRPGPSGTHGVYPGGFDVSRAHEATETPRRIRSGRRS